MNKRANIELIPEGSATYEESVTLYDKNTDIFYLGFKTIEIWTELFSKVDPDVRISSPSNLEGVLELSMIRYNDKKTKKDKIAHKAGLLLYELAEKAHAFVNGNKRMAYLITSGFLALNGYVIPPTRGASLDAGELANFIRRIANRGVTLNQTIKWISKNMREERLMDI